MNYEHKFKYGDSEINVCVEFGKRKHLSLIVYPDLRVVVRVPLKSKHDKIESIIQKKLRWIIKKIEYFENLEPIFPPSEFISGETHYFLGKPYRLKIQLSKKAEIQIVDNFIEIKLPLPDDKKKIEKMLMKWYKSRAKELLYQRIEKYLPVFLEIGAAKPEVKFRKMKSRWGSCSRKNVVTLNIELIKASYYCSDYVVVHELCHLIHLSHCRKFYGLLENKMPDWKERKKQLEKIVLR